MEALDRRFDGAVRMPVDLLVQLSHDAEGGGEIYDADAVNLGAEGIGLRSAILPDIGQRLRCRFELPDDGGTCETEARVVWASDTGTHTGEFGVKFDALEPRVQAVVDRWVSTIEGGPPRVITPVSTASPEPRRAASRGKTAQIHLDGVGTPIEGLVTSEDAHRVAIAQPLPFLALGKGATLEIGHDSDRRALSHVELLIENGVPRLVLTLEKMDRVTGSRATTKSAPPELRAPDATVTEDDEIVAVAPVSAPKAEAGSEWVTGDVEPETPAPESLDEEPVRAARDLDRMREREPVRAVRVTSSEREDASEETPSVSLQARITPHLVKLVAGMRAAWTIAIATAGPWARRAAAWLVQAAKAAASYVREKAPERMAALVGRTPRRRTTTPPPAVAAAGLRKARPSEAPASAASPLRGKGRLALAGVMAVVAVGLTAYALSGPAAAEPAPPDVPELVSASEAPPEALPAPEATLMPPPVVASPVEATEIPPAAPVEAAPVGGHLPAPTFPTLASTPSAAPAPAPAEVESSAPAPIASAPSSSFGADEVANGRTSTLRMSQPITSLVGQADESGFTVTIDGALSLDRAGPIAAANPSVERASILNRGDHCVLTVRFVAGRSPSYRVAIRGQAVEVTIGR